jgi:hypothetical protein
MKGIVLKDADRRKIPEPLALLQNGFMLAPRFSAVQFCFMKLLFKAYGCEQMEGVKCLLPGYEVTPDTNRLKSGDKIQVELADGTRLETMVVNTKFVSLTESALAQFPFLKRAKLGFYGAIQVPDDFSPSGIGLGANVYLDDSTPVQNP